MNDHPIDSSTASPIAVVRKNRREEIRVTIDRVHDRDVFSIRVWFDADDGESRPGRSGMAFRADLLPDFADAISLALEKARQQGLCE